MKALVIVNTLAGSAENHDQWKELFRAAGVEAEIARVPLEGLNQRIKRAAEQGADTIVAAGGDGTVNAVAAALIGSSLRLGILPAGTRNHFAKDLGIPLPTADAVAVIARGFTRTCDVGEVNERIFLNNSSIGAYPEAVAIRDERGPVKRSVRTMAMFAALLRVFRLRPLLKVRFTHDGKTYTRRTPFVFVGNNEYGNLLKQEKRPRLDGATLCIGTAKSTGLLCLLRLVRDGIFNRLATSRDFEYELTSEVKVEPHGRSGKVAVDGEIVTMKSPLLYRTRPGALKVIVPEGPPQ